MAETDGSYSHGFSTGRWAGRIAGLRAAARASRRAIKALQAEVPRSALDQYESYGSIQQAKDIARWCEREVRKLKKEARRA